MEKQTPAHTIKHHTELLNNIDEEMQQAMF